MKKNLFVVFLVFACFLFSNDSMGSEMKFSIQVVYEIDPQVQAIIDSIGENGVKSEEKEKLKDSTLKYDKAFRDSDNQESLLKTDDWDVLKESTKSQEFRKALDTKKITAELFDELIGLFRKKGFLIKDGNADYQVSFKVQKISYDDFKGMPHVQLVYYKLKKGQEIIYQGSFVPEEKSYLFGGGAYTQLLKTRAVAVKIANDLYDKIK